MQKIFTQTHKKLLKQNSLLVLIFIPLSSLYTAEFILKGNKAVEEAINYYKSPSDCYTHIFHNNNILAQAKILKKDIHNSYFGPLKNSVQSDLNCKSLYIDTQCNASRSLFYGCIFDASKFENSDFSNSVFQPCHFSGNYKNKTISCKIVDCNFSEVRLSDAILDYTIILNTDLKLSSWKNVTLKNCIIAGNTNFSEADLRGIKFVMEEDKNKIAEEIKVHLGIHKSVVFSGAIAYEDQRSQFIAFGASNEQLDSISWSERNPIQHSKMSVNPKYISDEDTIDLSAFDELGEIPKNFEMSQLDEWLENRLKPRSKNLKKRRNNQQNKSNKKTKR
ncbi:pentapeptide repeat-containing protein [Candidatus Dependentiae bacterium]